MSLETKYEVSEARSTSTCYSCRRAVHPQELQITYGAFFMHLHCINESQALDRAMFWTSAELSQPAHNLLASFITGTQCSFVMIQRQHFFLACCSAIFLLNRRSKDVMEGSSV